MHQPKIIEQDELLLFLIRRKGCILALAEAYFDESGTGADAQDLCLAGYIFEKEHALAFDVEWREMLAEFGLPHFHMKHCAHNSGVYKHLTPGQCDTAARMAISIIKAHAAQGIAISVDKSVGAELRQKSLWRDPYAFITGQVLFGVRKWAEKTEFEGSVNYLFEAGAQGWGQAHSAALQIINDPAVRQDFRVGTFAPGLKDEHTPPLQAADMLAWHWLKHCRRKREGIKELRKDFKALIELPMDAHHYDQSAVDFLLAIRRLNPAELSGLDSAARRHQ